MQTTSRSSGSIGVSEASIHTGAAVLTGVSLTCGTTADATVTIFDSAAADNTLVYNVRLDATVDGVYNFDPLPNIKITTGMFVTVTGTAAIAVIYYK